MKDNIVQVNVLDQYVKDSAEYALYANRTRTVPNVIDGFKSVHRRIVYAAYNDVGCYGGRRIKSASVVGKVMDMYHPHGDTSIYDSIKILNNWFETYMPIFDGEGNWGTFQGDGAAAMRYTLTQLSKFAVDCVIGDLKKSKQVCNWIETYDGRHKEPEALALSVPLLLINGSYGIGFGIKVVIPPHNVNDVIDATIKLIKNPNAEITLIPEQCMSCDIIESNFKSISNKGWGSFRVRGRMIVTTFTNHQYKNNPCLEIISTPDMVFSAKVQEAIEKLSEEKKLPQVIDVIEKSTEVNMRLIVILKHGADPNFVKEVIYKNTGMESTVKVNFEVLDNYNPLRMSYKSYLQSFIEFRKTTKFRLYANQLQNVRTKMNEREAYMKTLQSGDIDQIIKAIRKEKTIDDNAYMETLISKYDINDLQAKYILSSQISKLSEGYLNKCIADYEVYKKEETDLLDKLFNEERLLDDIITELLEFKKKYGGPRRCKVIPDDSNNIPKGEFKIVITQKNYIKKIQLNDPVGIKGDIATHILKVENTESILIFDEQGKMFKLPVHKIPFSDKNSNGIDIRTIAKKLTSNICAVMYEPKVKELTNRTRKYFLTILTAGGNIKKLDLEDALACPPSGIIYIKLDNGDYVKDISIVGDGVDVIVYSKNKALRMNVSEIPHQKRNTKGQRAIQEPETDGLSIITPDTTDIIVVTESGKINRFDVVALPNLGRNKMGSKVIKLSKGDSIKYIFGANKDNILKIQTATTKIEIPINDIKIGSSISAGDKMIPLKNDNIVKCMIRKKA